MVNFDDLSRDDQCSFSFAKENWLKVGQLIKLADGSSYLGKIIKVDFENDRIEHICQNTNKIYYKSVFGIFCRYYPVNK